ncbi:lysozyme inhibitor LprI family protein [Gillisia hiemivivida]|uniref:DUF1311 domain-containing protein n=1 Tax=Gillisia hiemivivida TaxID=291190 RepID=A0A5C6ZPP3_9FLAO|nr:lysozyme inhibitor LprI family protein [Gillisia hiemivivida]TXD91687.1 DUF1311 domain-containing protein [Gillisia hiemivivida]
MKTIFTIIILTLCFNCFSQTQAEMNQEAYDEFNKSNDKLNEIYQTILSGYKNDTLFIENLKISQRIWVQFRDAEMEMKYPKYPNRIYGSIHPTCRAFCLKELTEKRITTLKKWTNGEEEGDVCNGSVKIIEEIESKSMGKATIQKDSSVWITANMKRNHRIFGYEKKNIHSSKMILLSIFTNEVENNPFECKYGAYYDTSGMTDLDLKYQNTQDEFIKIALLKKGKIIDEVFMLKKWFEFK